MTTTLPGLNPQTEPRPTGRTEPAEDAEVLFSDHDLYMNMTEGLALCRMIFEDGEGPDFVHLAVNPAFETLTGLENVVGKRVTEVIPGIRERDPGLLRTYAAVATTGVPQKFETYVEALQMWFSISAYSPKKNYFVAVFDVITGRKLAEKALRESETSLRALFDDSPLPYHEIDKSGTVRRVNRTECAMLGLDASEMIGRPIWDFVVPEEVNECRAAVARKLAGPSAPPLTERTFRSRTGSRLVFQIHDRLITDESGAVVGIRTAMVNLTEVKGLSGSLETERRRHHALMDQLPDHIYFKDTENRFTQVNAGMARFLGLSDPAEAVGKTDFDFFSPEHAGPAYADEQDLVHQRVPMVSKEEKETWPDGRETWALTTKLPLRDAAGRITGTFGISRDITERRLSEERLRILSTAVEQSPVSIIITDLKGNIEYANPRAAEMTGYTTKELIGQNPRVLKSGETPAEEYRKLWKTIAGGGWRGTLHNRKKNGELYWVSAAICPIHDTSGALAHYIGVSEDITARKMADEEIAWLASFPEQNPHPVLEIEASSGTVRYVNPAARKLFPDLAEQGMAHTWLAGLEEWMEPAIRAHGGMVARDVVVGERHYGQSVQYLPETRRLRVYGIDITDCKLAEEAMRRSETKFRTIHDSSSDALMLSDESSFINCNRAATLMFGCATSEEFCSYHPAELSPPEQPCGTDSFTLAKQHIAEAMAEGHAHFEWVHKRLDTGETFHADVILNAMEIDGKRMLQGVVRNVTDRKRAENALRESELKYRTLVRHLPQRIFFKDRESVYVSCNDLYANDLGIAANDVAGKTDFDFFPRELAEGYRADDRRILELGRTVELEEEIFIGGQTRNIFTVKTPVSNERGEVIGVLGVFTDITERKRAEEALLQTERQLRLAQKLESIGRLAAGIAHEINTPIQYIGDNARFLDQAFLDLAPYIDSHKRIETALVNSPERALGEELGRILLEVDIDYLRDEVPKAIAQLSEGVEHVAQIVRAMKEFSHPGPAEMTPVDLNRAIESTVLVSKNEWKYVADLTTSFGPDLPPVPCIGGEFNQVMLNLIVNAAHAIADVQKVTGKKGLIDISTRRNGEWAEIRVRDTGSGIPEGIQSKVFDPFFTTKGVGKGTGQGLAIAHGVIVRKHRGTLSFESQIGTGTTFLIQLPLELQEVS